MKYLTILSVIVFSIFLTSCGDDSPVNDCSSSTEINEFLADESEKLTTVLTSFITDQSEASCRALEDAYSDYIDALKGLQGCANEAGIGAEFEMSISEAEASLVDFSC